MIFRLWRPRLAFGEVHRVQERPQRRVRPQTTGPKRSTAENHCFFFWFFSSFLAAIHNLLGYRALAKVHPRRRSGQSYYDIQLSLIEEPRYYLLSRRNPHVTYISLLRARQGRQVIDHWIVFFTMPQDDCRVRHFSSWISEDVVCFLVVFGSHWPMGWFGHSQNISTKDGARSLWLQWRMKQEVEGSGHAETDVWIQVLIYFTYKSKGKMLKESQSSWIFWVDFWLLVAFLGHPKEPLFRLNGGSTTHLLRFELCSLQSHQPLLRQLRRMAQGNTCQGPRKCWRFFQSCLESKIGHWGPFDSSSWFLQTPRVVESLFKRVFRCL